MRAFFPLLFLLFTLTFGGVLLNFNEVDIKAVAAQLAKVLGKNLVIDPRVKGKITLISTREVSAEEALEMFSRWRFKDTPS